MATKRIPPGKNGPTSTGAPPSCIAPQPPSSLSPAARYAAAAERLDDTNVLLHGLHRRHKNQHRVSTFWWPSFGQLRRHVRKLEAEVRAVQAPDNSDGDDVRLAVAHSREMRDQFIPKAYLAFSRLVADRRHAQLGLLLMGVLAQVHTALRQITGDVATKTEASGDDGGEQEDGNGRKLLDGRRISTSVEDDDDNDLGEVIAREEDTEGEAARKKEKATKLETAEQNAPKKPVAPATTPARKRPRPDASDDSEASDAAPRNPRPQPTAASTSTDDAPIARPVKKTDGLAVPRVKEALNVRDEDRKKEKRDKKDRDKDKAKKAKKRKKNGDEFDDLFSGLL